MTSSYVYLRQFLGNAPLRRANFGNGKRILPLRCRGYPYPRKRETHGGFHIRLVIYLSPCDPFGAGVVTKAIAPVKPPTAVAANHSNPSAIASSFRMPAIPNSSRYADSRIPSPFSVNGRLANTLAIGTQRMNSESGTVSPRPTARRYWDVAIAVCSTIDKAIGTASAAGLCR